jgi:hypothetical protein
MAPMVEWDGSDEELARLALAADPDAEVGADAVPLGAYLGAGSALPDWYMPAVTARGRSRRRTATVALIVASFLLIDGLGLCITYGQLVIA